MAALASAASAPSNTDDEDEWLRKSLEVCSNENGAEKKTSQVSKPGRSSKIKRADPHTHRSAFLPNKRGTRVKSEIEEVRCRRKEDIYKQNMKYFQTTTQYSQRSMPAASKVAELLKKESDKKKPTSSTPSNYQKRKEKLNDESTYTVEDFIEQQRTMMSVPQPKKKRVKI